MRKHKRFFPLHFAMIFMAWTVSDRLLAEEAILGQYPLCEASSALLVACPGGIGECLMVGDNEQKKELYLFPVKDQKLDSGKQSVFDLHLGDDEELSDIEALAGVSDNEILAFASHSRNTSCEGKKDRRQFGKVSLSKAETVVVDTLRTKKVTCEHLFGNQKLTPSMQAVCETIDAADKKAAQIDDDVQANKLTGDEAKDPCNAANAYNAEGAVAIGNDVWVGLRVPLLPEHPSHHEKKNLAILLHMKDQTAYTFDRVAFVDLDGRGIRDLSSDATSIWMIGGPPEDRKAPFDQEPFELRRIPKSALDKTEVINSELISHLPPSSEGLAISGKTAYIVIDGDTGKGNKGALTACKEPARYKIVSLP